MYLVCESPPMLDKKCPVVEPITGCLINLSMNHGPSEQQKAYGSASFWSFIPQFPYLRSLVLAFDNCTAIKGLASSYPDLCRRGPDYQLYHCRTRFVISRDALNVDLDGSETSGWTEVNPLSLRPTGL